jgi:hypothetical protein
MSVLEFSIYVGFYYWKQDFRDKFIKHLTTRPWSPVQVKQWSEHDSKKPRDQTRGDEKLRGLSLKSAESCGIRSFIQSEEKLTIRAYMQRRKDLEDSGTDTRQSRPLARPKWAQAGRPSPFQGPVDPPLTYPLFGLFIAPRPRATHQFIHHRPPRSGEERDTISERRGSS